MEHMEQLLKLMVRSLGQGQVSLKQASGTMGLSHNGAWAVGSQSCARDEQEGTVENKPRAHTHLQPTGQQ